MAKDRTNPLLSILSLKANSDLRTISKNGALLRTYYYDQAGQLTQEINHELGSVNVYHYDAGGNLSYCNSGLYDPNHITELWKDKTYTYGDANWKDKLTAYNGKPITYDEIGNPLTYDGWAYTWEAGRQLKKQEKGTTSIEYTYDENGLRTQKKTTENDKTTVYDYVWKGDRLIGLTIDAGISIEYLYFFYDEDGKAAGFVHDNTDVYFYQLDAQGNVNALVKQDGTTAAQYTYDAWGNLLSSKGEMAKINPLTYRGYQYDQETGLYYLQSRYYNPEWGRFINADNLLNDENVFGFNLMIYCNNNPIRYVDRNGHISKDEFHKAMGLISFYFLYTEMIGKPFPEKIFSYKNQIPLWDYFEFKLKKWEALLINLSAELIFTVIITKGADKILKLPKVANAVGKLSNIIKGFKNFMKYKSLFGLMGGLIGDEIGDLIKELFLLHFEAGDYILAYFVFVNPIGKNTNGKTLYRYDIYVLMYSTCQYNKVLFTSIVM